MVSNEHLEQQPIVSAVDVLGASPQQLRHLAGAVMSMGSDLDISDVLQRIASAAVDLVGARYGALGVLDGTGQQLVDFVTVGIPPEDAGAIGRLPKGQGILGTLIAHPEPLRLPDISEHPESYGFPANHPPMKSFLGVPIRLRDEVFGNLYLTEKKDGTSFTKLDEELVVGLASAAAVAIENARLHGQIRELAILEERQRIARDLHDSVIQHLFAVGLSLQSACRFSDRPELSDRIHQAVDDLDITIKEIRSAIYDLEMDNHPHAVRNRVMALATAAADSLGFEPEVSFIGPVDATVDGKTGANVIACLRESLSNVVRHAGATWVSVCVEVGDHVILTVADNGKGIPDNRRQAGNGLRNLEKRATELGGTFSAVDREPSGTFLTWKVPGFNPK